MKIGIITLFDNGNLGAALQAHALSRVLQRMGHQCVDIRYERVSEGKSDAQANWIKRRKMLSTWKGCKEFAVKAICTIALRRKLAQRGRVFSRFISENITQSEKTYRGFTALARADQSFDCYICGSDNIWNKLKFDPTYFLAFVPDDIPKFSYAAGLSAKNLSDADQRRFLPLIERLDAVSVRDSIGVRLLRSLTDKPVREDVDPTLLLTADEWTRMRKPVENVPLHYIFCYLLGNNPDARKAARRLKQSTGLPIVNLPHATTIQSSDIGFGDVRKYDVDPAGFLTLVSGADYVITDSFHGSVFSILFNRNFVAFRRFRTGTEADLNLRLDCLMERVYLPRRIAVNTENALELLKEQIDYQPVNQRIQELRADSLEYLRQITDIA